MDPYHARVAPEPYTPLHTSEFHDDGATSFEEASQDRGQSGPPKMDSSMSAADELLQSTEVEQVASESEAVAPNNTVSGPKESDQDVSDDPDDDGGVGLFGSDSESEAPEYVSTFNISRQFTNCVDYAGQSASLTTRNSILETMKVEMIVWKTRPTITMMRQQLLLSNLQPSWTLT